MRTATVVGFALALLGGAAIAQTFPASIILDRTAEGFGFSAYGEGRWDRAGDRVAGIGDFNNDGFSDVAISAIENRTNGFEAGAVYIIFGFEAADLENIDLGDLSGVASMEMYGPQEEAFLGETLRGAGDLNGDGFDDIVIGSLLPTFVSDGKCYVVFGSASPPNEFDLLQLDGSNGFVIEPNNPSDQLCKSADGVGDVNGDGLDDLAVGAQAADTGGFSSGEAYVIFGRKSFPASFSPDGLDRVFTLESRAPSSSTGNAVSPAGDVNRDGIDDFLVGSFGADTLGNSSGEAYLVFGSARLPDTLTVDALDGTNGAIFLGADAGEFVGSSVAAVGDVNLDGFDDFLVGAYRSDPGADARGAAYLVFGRTSYASENNLAQLGVGDGMRITGTDVEGFTGVAVGGDVDIDGDGVTDFFVGSSLLDKNGADAGAVHLIFGGGEFPRSISLDEIDEGTGVEFLGAARFDGTGGDVGSAGDFNGDGLGDIIIGSFEGNEATGTAHVIFGRFATGITLGATAASCPGGIDFRSSGLSSGGELTIFRGSDRGSSLVEDGPCAGVQVDLAGAVPVADQTADSEGGWSLSVELGDEQFCGTPLQLVDLETCQVSNVTRVPAK